MRHILTRSCRDSSGTPVGATESITGAYELNLDETVPGLSDNALVAWTCTVPTVENPFDDLVSLFIVADRDCTIRVLPQEEAGINLEADSPLIWSVGTEGLARIPFAGDVTALYVTVAGSEDCGLKILALTNRAP